MKNRDQLDYAEEDDGNIIYQVLELVAGLPEEYSLLDLGTGRGEVVNYFRKKDVKAYGIDSEDVMPKHKGYFIRCDALALPFADLTFDVMLDILMIEQMRMGQKWEESNYALMEMERVLKPGGIFLTCMGGNLDKDMEDLGFINLTPGANNYFTYQKPKG